MTPHDDTPDNREAAAFLAAYLNDPPVFTEIMRQAVREAETHLRDLEGQLWLDFQGAVDSVRQG